MILHRGRVVVKIVHQPIERLDRPKQTKSIQQTHHQLLVSLGGFVYFHFSPSTIGDGTSTTTETWRLHSSLLVYLHSSGAPQPRIHSALASRLSWVSPPIMCAEMMQST